MMGQKFTISWSIHADVKANIEKHLRKVNTSDTVPRLPPWRKVKLFLKTVQSMYPTQVFLEKYLILSENRFLAMTKVKSMKAFILLTYCK